MFDMIRDYPSDCRPRERLLKHGSTVLSDAELLAILLGTGAEGKNVVYLARELLHEGLQALSHRDYEALVNARGIGPAKAARLFAMFELSRRLATQEPHDKGRLSPEKFADNLVAGYENATQERFGAAFLDAKHRVKTQREIFVGSADRMLVSTREVIRHALLEKATAVIVYHNHPSGDPTPSLEDVTFTQRLKQSLEMVDLELVDHLIIGSHRYMSMKARGQL